MFIFSLIELKRPICENSVTKTSQLKSIDVVDLFAFVWN